MKKLLSFLLVILSLFLLCSCKNTSADTLGVWWWNKDLNAEQYLSFAKNNGVTEIYFCDSSFGENTKSFITKANAKGIKVYWLAGEYQWLRDSSKLHAQLERYVSFQSSNADACFAGVHLDIEPHQDPNFKQDRKLLLTSLAALVRDLSKTYPSIKFDYDIPFWIDDEITLDGETMPAYAHIIKNADRVFMMSYRDTAKAIYDVSKDEIEYAKSIGKTLVLGVETYSTEGDSVSFAEEGKQYMYDEISKLRGELPKDFGVSIHQIKTWYDLKD